MRINLTSSKKRYCVKTIPLTKGTGAFRQNQTKNSRRKEKPCSSAVLREKIKVKTCGFLPFYQFFVLSSFPRSSYLCTILAPQPTISAINPFAPKVYSHFKLLILYFSLYFYCFCIHFIQFLMSYSFFKKFSF